MLHTSLAHITTQTPAGLAVVSRRWWPSLVRSCRQPLWRPAAAVNAKLNDSGKGMNWFFELEQEVREYELNQFGVVNNAVYFNFCEYGTFKLLDEIGFDPHIKLAVYEVTIKFISPLKRKEKYLLKLRIRDYSITRLYFEYQIVKLTNHELVMKTASTVVLLNERMRPSQIPPSMIIKYNHLINSNTR
ncbi:acyl-acyl carrier protein thioesterase ATL3, chloroplastic-like [Salvia divinorum]|uniref:Acyl-acyl carrier protein thioesterase ATL3, chloroplastic-like n=1 Tax=Salvia divinorum TaxID=28513 RepID=A0ABD1G0M8_SALDI